MSLRPATPTVPPGWRILADDLTGALDSAAAFAGRQEVPVFLQPVHAASAASGEIQTLATGTRDMPQAALHARLQACLPWFATAGNPPCFAFKKVDSLLRGNTFTEVAWLVQNGGFNGVVFAPAFPAQGRFTRQGRHWVGPPQQPEAPSARPPLALLDAFAAAGLQAQLVNDMGTLDLSQATGVLIPDVLNEADLARCAELSRAAAGRRWLWCGSAGLAWALARHWQLAPIGTEAAYRPSPLQAPPLVVTASRHAILRRQLVEIAPVCEHAQLPLPPDLSDPLRQGIRPLLLDLASDQPLSAAVAQAQLTQHAQHIVNTLPHPATLVVVGGDTLLALCQAAGTQRLSAGASPRAGWGRARLQGGAWDGVTCYSRSGAFGAPDDLSALLETLLDKEHAS